jgi:hypothetical protein
MLFLLTEQPGFDPKLLLSLIDDQHLRAHPEIVEQWVQQLAGVNRENEQLRYQVTQLSNEMPHGIKKATAHLGRQLKKRVDRALKP